MAGLSHALRILKSEPTPAIVKLLELVCSRLDLHPESGMVDEFSEILESRDPLRVCLRVHPAVPKGVRTARPDEPLPRAVGPIGQVREPDGLEAILRLAALWQRVGADRYGKPGKACCTSATATGSTWIRSSSPDCGLIRPVARFTLALAGSGPPSRVGRARSGGRTAAGCSSRILERKRIPLAPDDRHQLARFAHRLRGASRDRCTRRGRFRDPVSQAGLVAVAKHARRVGMGLAGGSGRALDRALLGMEPAPLRADVALAL